jgi:hypothetical protein
MKNDRPKAAAKPRRVNTGLDQQFPSTNYTRVVDDQQPYVYPPPPPKQPVRSPFPNMTSPDETHPLEHSYRYDLSRGLGKKCLVNGHPSWRVPSSVMITKTDFPSNGDSRRQKHDEIFRAATFSHQDWAERLKSTSPVKRGSKMRKGPTSKSDTTPDNDAMDVDSNETAAPEKPRGNGIHFDEFKEQKPFKAEGLNGVDDLKNDLPWESRASTHVRTDSKTHAHRLKTADYPQPPKRVSPPALDHLNGENWKRYVASMKDYMSQWTLFELNMIEHFKQRRIRLNTCMADNWIGMPSDGPPAEKIEAMNGLACGPDGMKAGYGAYMQWLQEDESCHAWWDTAFENHKQVMDELGQVREKLMSAETTAAV